MPHQSEDYYKSTRKCFSCQRVDVNLHVCEETLDGFPQKCWYCSQCMIGRTVKVFWPMDGKWYGGLVQEYNPSTDEHYVLYPDGETEWINIGDTASSHNSHQALILTDKHGFRDMGPPQRYVEAFSPVDQESARKLAEMKMGTMRSQGSSNRNEGGYPLGDGMSSIPNNHGNPVYNHPASFPTHVPPHPAPTNVNVPPPASHYSPLYLQSHGQNQVHQYNGNPPRYGQEPERSGPPPKHHHHLTNPTYLNNKIPGSNMELRSSVNGHLFFNSGQSIPQNYMQGSFPSSEPTRPMHPNQPHPRGPPPEPIRLVRPNQPHPHGPPPEPIRPMHPNQPYPHGPPPEPISLMHPNQPYPHGPPSEPIRPIHPNQPYPHGPPPFHHPAQRPMMTTMVQNNPQIISFNGPALHNNPQNISYNGPANYPQGPMIPNNVSNFAATHQMNHQHAVMVSNNNLGNVAYRAYNPAPAAAPRPPHPSHLTQRLEPVMLVQPVSLNSQPLYHPGGPASLPIPPQTIPNVRNPNLYQNQQQNYRESNNGTDLGVHQNIPNRMTPWGVDSSGMDYFSMGYEKRTRKTGARPWTKQEDELLLEIVHKFKGMPVRWPLVSESLPGRSGKQCRERYVNHLNPRLNNSHWHITEDATIFCLYTKLSSKWSKMAKLIPGRTDNNIKNRFHNLRRQLESEDNHRKGLSNVYEYSEEIRVDRVDPAPRYLQVLGEKLWEVPLPIIAAQSVLVTAEDPTVPGFKFKQFGPFREVSSTQGEQCFRCGLFSPSVQCSKYICNSTRWCFACCSIPPHLSGNLLRDVLNLRRSLDKEERTIVEGWSCSTSKEVNREEE